MPESPVALFALLAASGYALVGTVVLLHHLRQRRDAGHLGRPAVQWHGWTAGPHLAVLLLVGALVGAILMRLEQADMPVADVPIGPIGVMVGIGLALHAVAAVVRHRVAATPESLWYASDAAPLAWDDIDDYVETAAGISFFARERADGPGLRRPRRRIDVAVPRAHREAFLLVLSACVDARLEHAVRSATRDVAATRPDRDAV